MQEYHIMNLKKISIDKLSIFQEKEEEQYIYDRFIIDSVYPYEFEKPQFGFIFERVEKIPTDGHCFTMSKLKSCARYLQTPWECFQESKNENYDISFSGEEPVYVRAQVSRDQQNSCYDGSHCSLFLKLVGFRCIKRD